ncbi:hypothetical protein J5N97_005937 [Dioscorea zingiberensis]|uniref:Zinc finger PHD-type domain-containing protein n=1 Tax=Dioscorea zingiberensis TaxID=325984 RepID=A0A9D5D9E6_9LILI|nr:hypothetical protein J5N97_005937 [Dioscorea zingiberensis]
MPTAAISDPTAGKKRRAKIYGLHGFLGPSCPKNAFAGAFRDNIREFLRECGEVEEKATEGMPTWCTLLVDERTGVVAPLYTVEECVSRSPRPFCDYCRCAGWSHHLVSKRRYHFIIPCDEEWDKRGLRHSAMCQHGHLLHGLIHCNGFGHLLCINGLPAGSRFLPASLLMDLWDRLCNSLRARVVTVEDVARKKSMELRLLLGVAHGVTWFGRWGYRFATGSYGVDHHLYHRSLHLLAFLNLDHLISSNPSNRDLRRIVHSYRKLRRSQPQAADLYTVRDLLQFLLEIKRWPTTPSTPKPPPPPPLPESRKKTARKRCRDFALVAAELASRWPVRRLCTVAGVVVDALRESGGKLTRQEVRDAARLVIGDTGLIDFVLKSLGNCVVNGSVVRRAPNPTTRVLEFSIVKPPDPVESDEAELSPDPTQQGTTQVDEDIACVYKALIEARPEETRALLDCKHWVKTWALRDDEDDLLRFLVAWEPEDGETWATTRSPHPMEVVVVAAHAGVGELKEEAERTLRDTYCVLERFRVTAIEGIKGEDWDPVMFGGAESGAVLVVRGVGADLSVALRYEGGANAWAVGCACGARDDDGERMVACDVCDVWHHTRCVGIRDGDPVPPLFLCAACGSSLLGAGAAPPPPSAAAAFRNAILV